MSRRGQPPLTIKQAARIQACLEDHPEHERRLRRWAKRLLYLPPMQMDQEFCKG